MAKYYGPYHKDGRYYAKRRGRTNKPGPKRKLKVVSKLTKAKTKEVKKIVTKVINSKAESKYFQSTQLNALTRLNPIPSRNGQTALAVLGYAVGTGTSPQMSTITYGWDAQGNSPVIDLNMARLFGPAIIGQLAQNALEGSYASPAMCRSEWILQVPQQDTTERETYGTPLYIRMLRVKPRKQKYSEVDINPKNDLFLDQYGIERGISFVDFNQYELMMLKANSRKYEIIEDMTKVLQPASTIATLDIANGNTICTDLVRSGSNCKLVMNHKQPKKLYYVNANVDGTQPEDGQSNELIFFHFCKQGTDGNTGSNEKSVNITCKPVSTFKDF
ncbi:MAG: putative capsid protein [Cressdnaviricota sp.]|nr:MAG: putative capsid protein [Cressdnaviricota sp.]